MATSAVYGIYKTRADVENALARLKADGFTHTDISVLFPDRGESKEDYAIEKKSKAPEGAATGASTGVVVGVALGWLAGAGALAIPGVGPFIVAGPILGALAGASVGGAVGGLAGALIGMGIPEFEAKRYAVRVTKGETLLSVHCDDASMLERAAEILSQTGAEEIASSSKAHA